MTKGMLGQCSGCFGPVGWAHGGLLACGAMAIHSLYFIVLAKHMNDEALPDSWLNGYEAGYVGFVADLLRVTVGAGGVGMYTYFLDLHVLLIVASALFALWFGVSVLRRK